MNIGERVSYLNGLVEGLNISETSNEGKLLKAVIEVLGDISDEINLINQDFLDMGDEIDALTDEVDNINDVLYEEGYLEDTDFSDDEDEDDDDSELIASECPKCGAHIFVEEDTESLKCPSCGVKLFVEDECDGGCDCGHDHCHDDK